MIYSVFVLLFLVEICFWSIQRLQIHWTVIKQASVFNVLNVLNYSYHIYYCSLFRFPLSVAQWVRVFASHAEGLVLEYLSTWNHVVTCPPPNALQQHKQGFSRENLKNEWFCVAVGVACLRNLTAHWPWASKFSAFKRQRWRLHVSEKFARGIKITIYNQTKCFLSCFLYRHIFYMNKQTDW